MLAEVSVRFETFSFGSLRIDGVTYDHDVVIDCREVRKRNKKPSKKFREEFGHTPLSLEEEIPWKCRRLMIGTGSGALPVMEEVKREAKRRKIKLLILPTVEAIEELKQHPVTRTPSCTSHAERDDRHARSQSADLQRYATTSWSASLPSRRKTAAGGDWDRCAT